MKPRCFISFTGEDIDKNKLRAFYQYLVEKSGGDIEFFIDLNETTPPGKKLTAFMNKINDVDSVIMICSPRYKQKAEKEKDTGAYYECNLMKKRLKNIHEKKQNNEEYSDIDFAILPIIFSLETNQNNTTVTLESDNVVPDFIIKDRITRAHAEKIEYITKNQMAANNANIYIGKKKPTDKIIVSEKSYKIIDVIVNNCISETLSIFAEKSAYSQLKPDEIFNAIVKNTKAEFAPPLDRKIFTKTEYYESLRSQEHFILIGRKGSGKSTAKIHLENTERKKYKGIIKVTVSNIRINEIYSYVCIHPDDANISIPALVNDLDDFFNRKRFLSFVWRAFIYLYSMYIVVCEYKTNKLTEFQESHINKIEEFIERVLNKFEGKKWSNPDDISRIFYRFCLSNTYTFYNHIIKNSGETNDSRNGDRFFKSDAEAFNSEANLLNFIFSKEIIVDFNTIINYCSRKILFSFDAFDKSVSEDDAYHENQHYKEKADENRIQKKDFELLWTSALLDLSIKIKSKKDHNLYKLMDFCILLPLEKYLESIYYKKDTYLYSDITTGVNWSGIELAIMIRKRLEAISKKSFSKIEKEKETREELLMKAFKNFYPQIPMNVPITTSSRETQMNIFHYMLRNSFWRPRDLLRALGGFLRKIYVLKESKVKITPLIAKALIKKTSERIVNTDFLNEFNDLWPDIRSSMDCFLGAHIVMDTETFYSILRKKDFVIKFDNGKTLENIFDKIKFLYELGVIGIFATQEYKKQQELLFEQSFVFYDGMKALEGLNSKLFSKNRIILNPVFISQYKLDLKDIPEVLGVSDWTLLHELENAQNYNYIPTYFQNKKI